VIEGWNGLHTLVCGLALKVGVERLQRLLQPRPARASAVD
jgi:hypothetical protein